PTAPEVHAPSCSRSLLEGVQLDVAPVELATLWRGGVVVVVRVVDGHPTQEDLQGETVVATGFAVVAHPGLVPARQPVEVGVAPERPAVLRVVRPHLVEVDVDSLDVVAATVIHQVEVALDLGVPGARSRVEPEVDPPEPGGVRRCEPSAARAEVI